MSLAPRCDNCLELEPRCRCVANPNPMRQPDGLEPFEVVPREPYLETRRRFLESGTWL